VTDQEVAQLGNRDAVEDLVIRRLDDLLAGLASPGANERLQFGRRFLQRRAMDPSAAAGRARAAAYLVKVRERMLADNDRYRRAARSARQSDAAAALSAYSTLYRDRGLSSDTRLTAGFAVDAALKAMAANPVSPLAPGSVRRVALVGPGLDFTDKAEGYDFYPPQTIQPFALIDSLERYGFAKPGAVRLSTLDLSPRVNAHLEAARRRAPDGRGYVLQLPLSRDDPAHEWHPDLVAYWQQFGGSVGREVAAIQPPAVAGGLRVRAVQIRPGVVRSIVPYDLNIIVERLEPLPEAERFDVIVATNILVYYDAFDQALALANIAKMLRPGGFFLTNYAVSPFPPMDPSARIVTPVYFDKAQNGDTMFWYQKR
jgi:SAM-dependent methyltransferase